MELAPIRANTIACGFVDTPFSAALLGEGLEARREALERTLPIHRVVQPEDVDKLAVHLMLNTVITGATYALDGAKPAVRAHLPALITTWKVSMSPASSPARYRREGVSDEKR